MSRADRPVVLAIALAAAGCMRIYPDPELPDVIVEWFIDFECSDFTERVVVSLSSVDSGEQVGLVEATCQDGSVRFPDVARARYHLATHIEDPTGAERGSYDADLDLRDGLSKRVDVLFSPPGIVFSVGWGFDMDATCASLSATHLRLDVSTPTGERVVSWITSCESRSYQGGIPISGTFTMAARALSGERVVAISPASPPREVDRDRFNNFGILILSPCGAACPQLAGAR